MEDLLRRALLRLPAACWAALIACVLTDVADAQTTVFTYQGKLTQMGSAANGNYDLRFKLFDTEDPGTGTQQGVTFLATNAAVTEGIFTVELDFGAGVFPGAERFLEIAVRPAGAGAFTTLAPRQPINSSPYAIRSANTGNFIQNRTTVQPNSNFSISGNGAAGGSLSGNVVNTTTHFNINGQRVLSAPLGTCADNLFAGFFAGYRNTAGCTNTFVGPAAGRENDTGSGNSFLGYAAGLSNTTGDNNAFYGSDAGIANQTGSFNTFLGTGAGSRATGSLNTFVGHSADFLPDSPSGDRNTLLGAGSTIGTGPIFSPTNATAIGARARVDNSNSLVLGSIKGINGATASTNVGIGTTAPLRTLQIGGSTDAAFTFEQGSSPNAGIIRFGDNTGWRLLFGRSRESSGGPLNADTTGVLMTVQDNGRVGIGTLGPTHALSVNGDASKVGGGSWANFSDERLKNIHGRFTAGLTAILQLQPLRFEYRRDNALALRSDGEYVGLSAQAVQRILPEAVTVNDQGYLLVDNDPIIWAMLNAIKEQQAQIEAQRLELDELKQRMYESRSNEPNRGLSVPTSAEIIRTRP